jgi:phosphoglycerate kinase
MLNYLDQIAVKGQRVLMRVDFNVPLDVSGSITDDTRIKGVLPSIRYAMDAGARLIVCSHLGRPKGERVEKFSLLPAARRLAELLGREVPLASDCVGPEVEKQVAALPEGGVLLLENLRYHKGETKNAPDFADGLARLADIYVNDAFAVSHREHASVVGVAQRLGLCAAGFLMKKELTTFERAMEQPARPLVAILGGAKVSGKLAAIENILNRVDKLIVGGAMANTFLLAQGLEVGRSLTEPDLADTAKELLKKADEKGVKFYLPVDCVVAQELRADVETKIVTSREIPRDWMVLDIGPATVSLFREALYDAKTIVWNGPVGAFELDPFSRGTMALAQAVGGSHALSIVGGGDTDSAVHRAGEMDNVSYMSTGGGAFLTLLEGKELPGVSALKECAKR